MQMLEVLIQLTVTRTLTILTIILLTTFNCFGQVNTTFKKAERYKTNKFDEAIFPVNYFDILTGQRFSPIRQDIDKAEILLTNNLRNINKQLANQFSIPIIHNNLHKYKRQYFGYIDKNGDKILLISCFWAKDKDDNNRWLTNRVMALDGGSYYWNVKFNLKKTSYLTCT